MKYNAMPGSIIVQINDKQAITELASGILLAESPEKSGVEVAEVIAVGDSREDIVVGSKILFPTATGLKIEKNIFYLKYEDICAIVNE